MFAQNRSNSNDSNKKKFKVKKVSSESDNSEGSAIELDDPCAPKEEKKEPRIVRTPGLDPRFQQQDQTLRCYVMYTDFFRCEYKLGEGHEACSWFKAVYTSICPRFWIEEWDDRRAAGTFQGYRDPEVPYGSN